MKINGDLRMGHIDLLRGVSIFGILLVNMLSFHSPFHHIQIDYWTKPFDRYTYSMIDIFAMGNFYPLFSFLFGFSAFLLMEKLHKTKQSFPVIYMRRMIFLFLIGCMHAFLIWNGDILITYSILGIALLAVHRLSGKVLLWLGVFIFLIPNGLMALPMLFFDLGVMEMDWETIKQSIKVYSEGTLAEIFKFRYEEWWNVNHPRNFIFLFIAIFPLMLWGMGAAKLGWLHNPSEHRKKLTVILIVTSMAGLVLKLLPYLAGHTINMHFFKYNLGGPILALAIVTGVTLLYGYSQNFRRRSAFILPVGRMSMTNYLLQSIIGTLIFYSYGLGLYGQVGVFYGTLLAFLIMGLQLYLSTIWLRHFRMGPVEYVWRLFTYMKRQPFKREEQGEG